MCIHNSIFLLFNRLVVSLDTYMSDPTEMIHLLLNKVHIEEMNCFVEKFLYQYMLNHGLKNDHVFSLYIQVYHLKSR